MSTIIVKPSPYNGLHVLSSAAPPSKQPSLPSGPSFNPLHGADRHHGLRRYRLSFMKRDQREKLHLIVRCSAQPMPPPAAPSSPGPFPGLPGKGWIIGIMVSLFIPFMKNKWGPPILSHLKKDVEATIERVEGVVELVEKVAEGVEKVAEEIEEELPDGQFRNAVTAIEHAADQVDAAAHRVDDAIRRVEIMEEKIESRVEAELAANNNKQQ